MSPDGKWIAFIGSDKVDDPWGVQNERLWILPIIGGEPKCLTANDDFCLDCLSLSDTLFGFVADGGGSGLVQWTPDSKQIVVSIGHEGAVDLAVVDAKKGGIRFLTQGKHLVLGSNVSRNGKMMAVLCGDATSLVEAGTFDLGAALVSNTKPQILTSCNKELFTEIEVSRPEMFRVESTDGVKVQGWAMRPTTGKAKKFAAVLEVHGDPCSIWICVFSRIPVALRSRVWSRIHKSKGLKRLWRSILLCH